MEASNAADAAAAHPVPLRHQLRLHTASAHARVDGGLGGGLRSARDYSDYLAGMADFLDAAIAAIGAEAWLVDARARLAEDLGDPRGTAAVAAAAGAPPDPARVAGWRYVVAGSTLGARLLLRDALAIDGGAQRGRTRFLAAFSGGDAWPRCLAALDAAGFDADARARACEAALEAFLAAEAALQRARSQPHAA